MEKPKRLWDDIHTPEKLFWTETFEYSVWFPLDECVVRLQALRTKKNWFSPSYEVNSAFDGRVITADIRKLSKSGSVWGIVRVETVNGDQSHLELKAGVGPDLLFTLSLLIVMLIFFFPIIFSGNLAGILFILLVMAGLASAILYGVTWLKQSLIEDVQKAFEIPAVADETSKIQE